MALVQDKKGHHYVPQKYLSAFEDPEHPGSLWEYRRGFGYAPRAKRTSHANPRLSSIAKHVARDVGHYALPLRDGSVDYNTIEDKLQRLETPSDRILVKIAARQDVSSEERETFADYLLLTHGRVPARKQRVEGNWPEVWARERDRLVIPTLRRLESMLDAPEDSGGRSREWILRQRDSLLEMLSEYEKGLPREIELRSLVEHRMEKMRAAVLAMSWQFLTAPDGHFFVTSDNPVVITDAGFGLRWLFAEIVFPVTPRVALACTYQELPPGYRRATWGQAKEVNRRVIASATAAVYSPRRLGKTRADQRRDWIFRLLERQWHRHTPLYCWPGFGRLPPFAI